MIVQKEPAEPVYAEHSFVTWSCPFRPDCADIEVAPMVSETVRATKPATCARARAKIVVIDLNFIVVSFPVILLPVPNNGK